MRTHLKRESERVLEIPDLDPEMTKLAMQIELLDGTLDKLIAKGEPIRAPVPTLLPDAPAWTSDPRRTAELGEPQTILERRYTLRGPKGYTFAGAIDPSAPTPTAAYSSGKNLLWIQILRNVPEYVGLEDFSRTTRDTTVCCE